MTDSVFFNTLIPALIKVGLIFPVLMGAVAYLVLAERKLLGRFQQRLGPIRVGPWGILQPIADGLKLFLKEDIIPYNADRVLYIIAPLIGLSTALMTVAIIPWGPEFSLFGYEMGKLQIADVNVGLLYIFGVTSLGVYGIFLAGWSSGNKYSLLGALRSSAQMISYELSLGLSIVIILMATQTLQISEIVEQQGPGFWNWWIFSPDWLFLPGLIGFFIFMISIFAETNRLPFDLPEAETELVSGYNTEYSSMKFAMFFMGEYVAMIVASAVATTLFLGAYHAPLPFPPFTWVPGVIWFVVKVVFLLFLFIWIRATLPRFRYDQLMHFGWKVMLPLSLINIVLAAVGLLIMR